MMMCQLKQHKISV